MYYDQIEIKNQRHDVRTTCLEIYGSSSVSLVFFRDSHRWRGPSLRSVLDIFVHESRVLRVPESNQSKVDHACRIRDVHDSIRFYFGCTLPGKIFGARILQSDQIFKRESSLASLALWCWCRERGLGQGRLSLGQ